MESLTLIAWVALWRPAELLLYEHWPVRRQRQLARRMIDAGADAVVGGHPHVTQDIEIYQGKPVIYSLGNFVFDGFTDLDNNTGWLLRMDVDRSGVAEWHTVIARIDRHGTPHPDPTRAGQCWQRGWPQPKPCTASAANPPD